jgi:hypothetical protein
MKTTARLLPDPGTTVRIGAAHWRVAKGDEAILDAVKDLRYERRKEQQGLELLKDANHVFWGRLRVAGREWFLKGHRRVGLRRLVKSLFCVSDMREEWRKTWWLRSTGIETVEPSAVGEVRRFGVVVEAYFATRWVPGARDLIKYLDAKEKELTLVAFERLRRRVSVSLGRLLGSFHARGTYHRQFHDKNILAVEEEDGLPRLLPIDLDHLTICDRITEEDRDWNFYQLAWHLRRTISRWRPQTRDVARFLKGYYAADPSCAPSWRELFRRVHAIVPAEPLAMRPRREYFRRT